MSAVYLAADGFFDQGGQWEVVWPLHRLVAENLQFRSGPLRLPPNLLAFGDDGFGAPFCLAVGAGSASGVVRWSWIDDDVLADEGSLRSFMEHWAGCGEWPPADPA